MILNTLPILRTANLKRKKTYAATAHRECLILANKSLNYKHLLQMVECFKRIFVNGICY